MGLFYVDRVLVYVDRVLGDWADVGALRAALTCAPHVVLVPESRVCPVAPGQNGTPPHPSGWPQAPTPRFHESGTAFVIIRIHSAR
ncbi:hypothetical protein SRM_02225 [Salinibacter ruber M8]|uniref:Uncharacterized protein n=1 Tax=Salinibacter ruber (strain M8) TaxID=761659 RepID=D5HAU1_SALRM|nr:hypothetical protein SRM_02225 [Salinibacter ruber M8]